MRLRSPSSWLLDPSPVNPSQWARTTASLCQTAFKPQYHAGCGSCEDEAPHTLVCLEQSPKRGVKQTPSLGSGVGCLWDDCSCLLSLPPCPLLPSPQLWYWQNCFGSWLKNKWMWPVPAFPWSRGNNRKWSHVLLFGCVPHSWYGQCGTLTVTRRAWCERGVTT